MSRFGGWYRVFGQWGDKLQYTIDIPLSQRPHVETAQLRLHPAPERHVETLAHGGVNLLSEIENPIEVRFREEELLPDRARDLLHAVLLENGPPDSTRHKHVSPLERLDQRSLVTQADGEFSEGILVARSIKFATMNVTSIRFVPDVDLQVELAGNTLYLRPKLDGKFDESSTLSVRLPNLTAPKPTRRLASILGAHARRILLRFRIR